MDGTQSAAWFRQTFESIRTEVGKIIVGQADIVEGVLTGLAANGHVLLEGLPGLGKTLLVRSVADAVGLGFGRIQFTPDMMPADITGTQVLTGTGEGRAFEFRRGPIFAHLILADEINRATPKTQSAMLEAMQERSVTVAGVKHSLEEPFLVMATQNPIEQEGTYPLPEAQLDRFFLKLNVGCPTKNELAEVVNRTTGVSTPTATSVATREDILQMRKIIREVPVADNVLDFALQIVVGTHPEGEGASDAVKKYVRYGSSPRGAQAVITAAKVKALLSERYNVSKEDVVRSSHATLRHRLLLNFEADADGVTVDQLLDGILQVVQRGDRDPIGV